jgi:hypothetical protein
VEIEEQTGEGNKKNRRPKASDSADNFGNQREEEE